MLFSCMNMQPLEIQETAKLPPLSFHLVYHKIKYFIYMYSCISTNCKLIIDQVIYL